jgi:DNA repair exonuclease SbcCD ATPase subunit
MEKLQRQLEAEKDELQHALDEAEAALEAEEGKVMRTQVFQFIVYIEIVIFFHKVELSQIRAEIEKRLQEKEEEFENTRKAHQRIIEGMQTQLEQETRAKAELSRVKKKLESDVNVSK